MRAYHVRVTRTFSLAPERVFDYMAEHENLGPLFGAKVTRISDGTDGERNGVGSAREMRLAGGPPFVETVTEFERPSRIVYKITKGSPLKGHVGVMQFSPHGQGTRLDYDIRIASNIPGLAPIVKLLLTRQILHGLGRVEREA